MKKLLIKLTLLNALLFTPVFSKAGDGSHGGDAYLCFDTEEIANNVHDYIKKGVNPFDEETLSKIKSIKLLDLEEIPTGEEYVFKNINRQDRKKGVEQIKQKIYSRLQELIPTYADIIKNYSDLKYYPTKALPEINDESIKFSRDKNCVFAQIAIQNTPTGDVNYFEKLYDLLSAEDIAALDFHEKLLKNYINAGGKDSYFVRKLVAFLFSHEFLRDITYPSSWENSLQGLRDKTEDNFKRYQVFNRHKIYHTIFEGKEYPTWIISTVPDFDDDILYFHEPSGLYINDSETLLGDNWMDQSVKIRITEKSAPKNEKIKIDRLRFTYFDRIFSDFNYNLGKGVELDFFNQKFFMQETRYEVYQNSKNGLKELKDIKGSYLSYSSCTLYPELPKLISELSKMRNGWFICSSHVNIPKSVNYSFGYNIRSKKRKPKSGDFAINYYNVRVHQEGKLRSLYPSGSIKQAEMLQEMVRFNESYLFNDGKKITFNFDEEGIYTTISARGLKIKNKDGSISNCSTGTATYDAKLISFICD